MQARTSRRTVKRASATSCSSSGGRSLLIQSGAHMKRYVLAVVLWLVLVPAAGAVAVQVTPGGLTIEGQMYVTGDPEWDPNLGVWVPVQGWWPIELPSTPLEQPGDPQDLMYHNSTEIGVREGVFDISPGTFESASTIYLGHVIHTIDLTVQGEWPGSLNLLFELRSPMPGSDTVYWAATGPFSSEPAHAYVEFAEPIAGYEIRLAVVPEPSPLVALFSGLGLLAYGRRRKQV